MQPYSAGKYLCQWGGWSKASSCIAGSVQLKLLYATVKMVPLADRWKITTLCGHHSIHWVFSNDRDLLFTKVAACLDHCYCRETNAESVAIITIILFCDHKISTDLFRIMWSLVCTLTTDAVHLVLGAKWKSRPRDCDSGMHTHHWRRAPCLGSKVEG